MYLFLITFLTFYGGMHIYAFIRLRGAFRLRTFQAWSLIFWMSAMTFIPLLVRVTEQFGMEKTALIIAWPGYLWMGFLFIFTSALLFIDAVHYSCRHAFRQALYRLPESLSSRNTCKVALVLALIASIYAFTEASRIRSEHLVVTSSKLPSSTSRIRIVQVSDVHIGLLLREQRLEHILAQVREAKPNILISTGDLIDGKLNRDYGISERNVLAASLAAVSAPSGKFAVIGNHEVYAGLPQALDFTRAAGFVILRNQSIPLACGITISGIDDRAINPASLAAPGMETALLNSVSRNAFHLLLKHRPEMAAENDGRFDLQLSGHTHGGQIFPFNFIVKLTHPIPCGTTTTKAGSIIHVSRGTGTWGPPMRLFAPPEITIIDIVARQPVK